MKTGENGGTFFDRGGVGENCAKERQHQAEAAQHDIFPGGLEGGLAVVESDQKHGSHGGDFERDPHHAEIVGEDDQAHGGGKQWRQNVVFADAREGE